MTKAELVKIVAGKTNHTQKDVEAVLNCGFETIKEVVKNKDTYNHKGFGSFESKTREARKGRNPQTGKEIDIPETIGVKFKASKLFKDELNGK